MARTKRTQTLAGRDTFHVIGPAGELSVKGPAGPQAPAALALVVAQGRASGWGSPVELMVERRSVLGPSTPMYRVVRDEDGLVCTFTLAEED